MESTRPKQSDESPSVDGYMAGLRLSGLMLGGFAAILAVLLVSDPIGVFAYIGTISAVYCLVVIYVTARRLTALRKNGQGPAVAGFVTVMAIVWIAVVVACFLLQYFASTVTFSLRM